MKSYIRDPNSLLRGIQIFQKPSSDLVIRPVKRNMLDEDFLYYIFTKVAHHKSIFLYNTIQQVLYLSGF